MGSCFTETSDRCPGSGIDDSEKISSSVGRANACGSAFSNSSRKASLLAVNTQRRTEELSAHGFELASAAAEGTEGGAAPASCRASSSSYIITCQPWQHSDDAQQRTVTRRFLRLSGTSMRTRRRGAPRPNANSFPERCRISRASGRLAGAPAGHSLCTTSRAPFMSWHHATTIHISCVRNPVELASWPHRCILRASVRDSPSDANGGCV